MPTIIKFEDTGTFEAYHAAKQWCRDKGYSVGQMCGNEPIGILKESDMWIAKWKNLSAQEKSELDGIMSGDFRNGPVNVEIY